MGTRRALTADAPGEGKAWTEGEGAAIEPDPEGLPFSCGGQPAGNAAAFFDVDGTLVQGTVVHYYAWLSSRSLSRSRRALHTARLAARLPHYWWLDRRGRDRFL